MIDDQQRGVRKKLALIIKSIICEELVEIAVPAIEGCEIVVCAKANQLNVWLGQLSRLLCRQSAIDGITRLQKVVLFGTQLRT